MFGAEALLNISSLAWRPLAFGGGWGAFFSGFDGGADDDDFAEDVEPERRAEGCGAGCEEPAEERAEPQHWIQLHVLQTLAAPADGDVSAFEFVDSGFQPLIENGSSATGRIGG